MITMLNKKHNIISVSPEDVPENRKGQFIAYLQDWNAVVIAGWKENTDLVAELITEYLELTPSQHKEMLLAPIHMGLSGVVLNICETLEEIYQIRHKEEQHETVG